MKAKDIRDELDDIQLAYGDVQALNEELEAEVTKGLAETEKREQGLKIEVERLRGDVDSWKVGMLFEWSALRENSLASDC